MKVTKIDIKNIIRFGESGETKIDNGTSINSLSENGIVQNAKLLNSQTMNK